MNINQKIGVLLGIFVSIGLSIHHNNSILELIGYSIVGAIIGYIIGSYESYKNSPKTKEKKLKEGYSCKVKKQVMAKQMIGGEYPKTRFFRGRIRATDTAIIVTIGDSETHTFPYDEINDLHKRGANLRIGTNTDSVQIVDCSHTYEIMQKINGMKITEGIIPRKESKHVNELNEVNKLNVVKNEDNNIQDLEKIVKLYNDGALTEDEFKVMKKKIIDK